VAQTEGSIGFMLQQAIRNRLEAIGSAARSSTDPDRGRSRRDDPAFKRPTKPIGPFFTRYRAEALERDLGGRCARTRDAAGGTSCRRRAAAHPEHRDHRAHARSAAVVIAAGGGGIPVVRGRDGQWRGIEA
jgi:carbamate kinase